MNHLTKLALALLLTACSGEQDPPPAPQPTIEEPAAPPNPEPTVEETPTATHDPALLEAANAYVRENAADGFEFDLDVQAVEGDFARISVRPRQPDDGAMLFMHRTANGWTGIEMGTAISCADLRAEGTPESLCVGTDP